MHVPITKDAQPDAQHPGSVRANTTKRSSRCDSVRPRNCRHTRWGARDRQFLELLAQGLVPRGLEEAGPGRYRWSQSVSRVIETPTLLLKRPWWRNYGHWLVDAALCSRCFASKWSVDLNKSLSVARNSQNPKKSFPKLPHYSHQACRFLNIRTPKSGASPNCTTCSQSRSLNCSNSQTPWRHSAVRSWVMIPPRPDIGVCSFPRRHFPGRQLVNEAQVIDVFERYGFEVVFPEEFGASLHRPGCSRQRRRSPASREPR